MDTCHTEDMTTNQITSSRGGWHRTQVTFTNRTTGLPRTWTIKWRTQDALCEHTGNPDWDRVAKWDAENPPFLSEDQYGRPQQAWAQCGTCGRMHFGDFSAKEV